MMFRLVRGVVGAAALLGLVAGAACAGKNDKAGSSSPAPEDRRAPAAAVATGLHQIDAIAKRIASLATTDQGTAKQLDGQIEPIWATIEGTVKANDKNAYLSFEDNFAMLEKAVKEANPTLARQGADAVSKAVTDYLAKYPG
jgi:hypothetical protein